MSITGIIENDSVKLPLGVHMPDGTRVEIMLTKQDNTDAAPPSSDVAEQSTERTAWLAQSERRLREVWDNEADDVYNELLAR